MDLIMTYETIQTFIETYKHIDTFQLDSGIIMEIKPTISLNEPKIVFKFTF